MKHLRLTLNGRPARRVHEAGRVFLVAPVSMIVPGVLSGSKGALMYPEDEVAKNPGVWNGTPVTLGHPYGMYGQPLSAKDPFVAKRFRIGVVRNDRFERGKRVADAWFDESIVKNKAPEVHAALNAGTPMEISTGLFTDDEPAPYGATHNGVEYQIIARNYRPDHLAVLPNQRGACGLDDGCGLNPTFNCRRSAPMNRDNPETLDIPVPDWSEYASPAVVRDADRNDNRTARADDGLPLPTYDWSEIAANQDR